jgi:hypothetical protein
VKSAKAFARAVVVAAMVMAPVTAAGAATPVVVDWDRTPPLSGTVVNSTVRIESPSGGGTFPLAVIDHPPVDGPGYAIWGRIRYQRVEGAGFLEMWSVFPGLGRYFSRTLDTEGPVARIAGSSDWRTFELPFRVQDGVPPSRLEVNLILPGKGTVWIDSLQLVAGLPESSGWWSGRTGGLIGGIGGSVIGLLGALLGSLTARRRARRFVLGLMLALAVVGAGLIVVGGIALAFRQPYAVWFPLLLGGTILAVVIGNGRRTARRAFEDAELRKMRALDLSRP